MCIRKYTRCMPSKSKKANAKAFRRSRNKRSKMNKRTTRRRKGGECGDITKHRYYHNCVKAGCNKHECAAAYNRVSKPHKPIVDDEMHQLAAEMKTLTLKKDARDKRRTARRTASQRSHASTSSNLVQPLSPLTEERKEKRLQQWNNHIAGIPSSDSEDE
jgi:hypothetical protein